MGISNSVLTGKAIGSAGNITTRTSRGKTIFAQKKTSVTQTADMKKASRNLLFKNFALESFSKAGLFTTLGQYLSQEEVADFKKMLTKALYSPYFFDAKKRVIDNPSAEISLETIFPKEKSDLQSSRLNFYAPYFGNLQYEPNNYGYFFISADTAIKYLTENFGVDLVDPSPLQRLQMKCITCFYITGNDSKLVIRERSVENAKLAVKSPIQFDVYRDMPLYQIPYLLIMLLEGYSLNTTKKYIPFYYGLFYYRYR